MGRSKVAVGRWVCFSSCDPATSLTFYAATKGDAQAVCCLDGAWTCGRCGCAVPEEFASM